MFRRGVGEDDVRATMEKENRSEEAKNIQNFMAQKLVACFFVVIANGRTDACVAPHHTQANL